MYSLREGYPKPFATISAEENSQFALLLLGSDHLRIRTGLKVKSQWSVAIWNGKYEFKDASEESRTCLLLQRTTGHFRSVPFVKDASNLGSLLQDL